MKTTFTKVQTRKGSNERFVNVDRNGVPFGRLWTFKNTRTERHPWHAKPLNGEHRTFGTLTEAKAFMEG